MSVPYTVVNTSLVVVSMVAPGRQKLPKSTNVPIVCMMDIQPVIVGVFT